MQKIKKYDLVSYRTFASTYLGVVVDIEYKNLDGTYGIVPLTSEGLISYHRAVKVQKLNEVSRKYFIRNVIAFMIEDIQEFLISSKGKLDTCVLEGLIHHNNYFKKFFSNV